MGTGFGVDWQGGPMKHEDGRGAYHWPAFFGHLEVPPWPESPREIFSLLAWKPRPHMHKRCVPSRG